MKQLLIVLLAGLLLAGCISPGASTNQSTTATPTVAASLTPTPQQISSTVSGGNQMALTAQKGDKVAVDYVGTLDNGTVFDTSIQAEAQKAGLPPRPSYAPLEVTIGSGQVIPGFDAAIVGMKENETKQVHLEPSEAYGQKSQDQIITVPENKTPAGIQVGAQLTTNTGIPGIVTNITNETVTIDFNHPLAGLALNFKITLRKITRT